jgi:fimbrial chaperone protein
VRPLLALALAAIAFDAAAGAFGVSPIRIDLDPAARSGLVTVSNDDERKQHFQLKLFEWTQSSAGEDQLAESSELIFFPQLFTVEAQQKRIVRVGVKAPPEGSPRAFRLFIEELPGPDEAPGGGAQIAVRLRFGVPIFLSSGKGEALPDIDSVEATKGALRVGIRNSGSRPIRFEEVTARAGDKVVAKSAGWYVFPGATRAFVLAVAPQDCPLPRSVEIRAVGDGKDIRKSVEPPGGACPP